MGYVAIAEDFAKGGAAKQQETLATYIHFQVTWMLYTYVCVHAYVYDTELQFVHK